MQLVLPMAAVTFVAIIIIIIIVTGDISLHSVDKCLLTYFCVLRHTRVL